MIDDEFSMLSGALNHAASLLFTYAREAKFRLRREDYALPRERYGRVPLLAWAGDHLQLPPHFAELQSLHHAVLQSLLVQDPQPVQTFSTLFADKIDNTHAEALEALRRLGWWHATS